MHIISYRYRYIFVILEAISPVLTFSVIRPHNKGQLIPIWMQFTPWVNNVLLPAYANPVVDGRVTRLYPIPWTHTPWLLIKSNNEVPTGGILTASTQFFMSILVAHPVTGKGFNTLRPRKNGRHLADDISNAFSWMEIYEFRLKFHWSLFLRDQLTIF